MRLWIFIAGTVAVFAADVMALYALVVHTDCPELFAGMGQGVFLTYGLERYFMWLDSATRPRTAVYEPDLVDTPHEELAELYRVYRNGRCGGR